MNNFSTLLSSILRYTHTLSHMSNGEWLMQNSRVGPWAYTRCVYLMLAPEPSLLHN